MNHGPKHHLWKGNNVTYSTKHSWIRNNYGEATSCTKDQTHVAKRYDWANISGKYKRHISDYVSLCPSCHKLWDIGYKCKRGHIYNKENTLYKISKHTGRKTHRECRICRRIYQRKHIKNERN